MLALSMLPLSARSVRYHCLPPVLSPFQQLPCRWPKVLHYSMQAHPSAASSAPWFKARTSKVQYCDAMVEDATEASDYMSFFRAVTSLGKVR